MARPLLEAIGLHKTYRTASGGVHAVAGVDVEVGGEEFVAIVGPSGSGKSTLMSLLGLLDRPDAGTYRLDGRDVGRLDPEQAAAVRNREIGFVFQSFNLLARRTAIENVELPLVYAGIGRAERRTRAALALERVGLAHRHEHWPHQLSGGEQQRVAIARALIMQPALILADEPTGAIDSRTGREILALFGELNEAGHAVVVVTHDMDVAGFAHRVVSMQDGRVVKSQKNVAARPAAPDGGGRVVTVPPRLAFINALESLAVALRGLRANLLRSALTVLGIVIGVGAVITMVAIGAGANVQIGEQIRSLGTNLLLIQPGAVAAGGVRLGTGTGMSLSETDAASIAAEVPGVQVAAPGVAGTAQLVYGNRNWATTVGGVTPAYLIARDWRVAEGRAFTVDEVATADKVVLLGATTVARLFEARNPIGQLVRIGNVPFTVIGVLARKGQSSAAGRDQDDVALLPLSTAKLRLFGRYSQLDRLAVDYVLVKLNDARGLDAATTQVGELLRQRHRIAPDAESDFVISDPAAAIVAQAAATRTLSVLLFAVSSVALVVGGISIMNIMLVSVTERTREIGIRLAVGARRRDVRTQFLIEASLLCLIGGAAGLLVGGATAGSIAAFAGWPVFLGPEVVALAVGSATLVGLGFGLYPAMQAARMDPIEALRFE